MSDVVGHHVAVGVAATLATVGILAWRFRRAPRNRRMPAQAWAGLTIILAAELFLFLGVHWVGIYFTPVAWSGYLLLVDGLVESLRGASLLTNSPRRFVALAAWSVPLWLIFEAYNLRLKNWAYMGLPRSPVLACLGFVWSFATIWPAIFETAELVEALRPGRAPITAPNRPFDFAQGREPVERRRVLGRASVSRRIQSLLGFLLLSVPLLLPARLGRYLFGAVWLGFIPLLEPINYRRGGWSLLREIEKGSKPRLKSFAISGAICGVLWEFWNYWAEAKWVYVFPIGQGTKVFEMPLAGFLGFPAFAIECLVMFEFVGTVRRVISKGRVQKGWPAVASEP
jgi:hypothetical protein